ncbi:WG repeat-containing protein [Spongiimicrobium salis]|uniref:WG repeat-containing protein n=1 Tax=Spongiimicrobium salis TaxID=1667022 RepID=UPI00374DCE3E
MKLNQYEWNPDTDMIATGAFAEVFKAKDIHHQNRYVALKIYKEGMAKGAADNRYTLEKEFQQIDGLSHTNIISFYGLEYLKSKDAMGRNTSYPVIIMEYATEGTLHDFLKTNPDQTTIDTLITQLIQAVAYLHTEGIIHRDLKPGNILITKNRRGEPTVKLTDFGISKDTMEDSIEQSLTEGVGTPHYMAPEQFFKKKFGLQGTISPRTDIWGIGIIVYRILCKKRPFEHQSSDYEIIRDAIINDIVNLAKVPENYKKLIRSCLQKTAADRPENALELLDLIQEEHFVEEDLTLVQRNVPKPQKKVVTSKKKKWVPIVGVLSILGIALAVFLALQKEEDAILAVVRMNQKFGYINTEGNEAIPFAYDGAWSISEGLALVQKNQKWGFINKEGETVIPFQYDDAHSFADGLAAIKSDGKWGFIDPEGTIKIPLNYDDALSFKEGLAPIKSKGKWGFINKEEKMVIPLQYDGAYSFSEGLAVVRIQQKEGFINKRGQMVITPSYDYALSFAQGLAAVNINEKWGFINKEEKMVIPATYEHTWGFSENLAAVRLDEKWGFITKEGVLRIPPKYEDASGFSNGMSGVRLNGKEGFIDEDDNVVISFKYDYADAFLKATK